MASPTSAQRNKTPRDYIEYKGQKNTKPRQIPDDKSPGQTGQRDPGTTKNDHSTNRRIPLRITAILCRPMTVTVTKL